MRAEAVVADGLISGLGAHNPKGHAACAMVAFEALAESDVVPSGDLMLGLGAGGMPTDARPGMLPDSGHGVGSEHMLRQGTTPDYAVIAKSGWTMSWEEVGLAWYEVNAAVAQRYVVTL